MVNASGFGARELTSDDKVLPVFGQTMLIKGSVNEAVLFQGPSYDGLRVERQGHIVHAYDAGGLGYVSSWGVEN